MQSQRTEGSERDDSEERQRKERAEASIRQREKEVAESLSVSLKQRDREREHHRHEEARQNFQVSPKRNGRNLCSNVSALRRRAQNERMTNEL